MPGPPRFRAAPSFVYTIRELAKILCALHPPFGGCDLLFNALYAVYYKPGLADYIAQPWGCQYNESCSAARDGGRALCRGRRPAGLGRYTIEFNRNSCA